MSFTLNCPYTSSNCPILAPYADGSQPFPRPPAGVPGFPNHLQQPNGPRGCAAQIQIASPELKQTSIHPASTLVDGGSGSGSGVGSGVGVGVGVGAGMRDEGSVETNTRQSSFAASASGNGVGVGAGGGAGTGVGGELGDPAGLGAGAFARHLSDDELHDADGGDGTGGSTAFISKLYHLCSHPDYGDYIRWNNAGDAFIFVQGNQHFANLILPRFFRHSNVSSFIRQLNLYSFTRLPTIQLLDAVDNSTSAPTSAFSGFSHPHFRRGDEAALAMIKPKSGKKTRTIKKAAAGVSDKVKRAEGKSPGWSGARPASRSR